MAISMRWQHRENGKWLVGGEMVPHALVFKKGSPKGFLWVCDDEMGYRPTIPEAKRRAEATHLHRIWYGARRETWTPIS